MDRVRHIEELTRQYEGIDDDTDVADLIADEIRSDPDRDNETIARIVAQRIVQA